MKQQTTMENKQDILKRLASPDVQTVSGAIEELRENGDIFIVPELLEILLHSNEPAIVTPVTSWLSDVKDSNFKTVLIEKLINAPAQSNKANLLRICWESAIDFSEFLEIFTDILIEEDFINALEASTVIENLNGNIADEKIEVAIRRLSTECKGDKKFLAEDAIAYLEELLVRKQEEEKELAKQAEHRHQHEEDCGCHPHD